MGEETEGRYGAERSTNDELTENWNEHILKDAEQDRCENPPTYSKGKEGTKA